MALTRDAILELEDRPSHEVEVPEWGGSVFVRPLSGKERHDLLKSSGEVSAAVIVAFCAVGEDGERLFSEADVEALEEKHSAALERIVAATLRFNALDGEAVEEGKGD